MHATRTTSEAETDVETESNTGFLPDQLINPGEYEPLLPTTEEHYTQLLNPQKKPRKQVHEEPRRLHDACVYLRLH